MTLIVQRVNPIKPRPASFSQHSGTEKHIAALGFYNKYQNNIKAESDVGGCTQKDYVTQLGHSSTRIKDNSPNNESDYQSVKMELDDDDEPLDHIVRRISDDVVDLSYKQETSHNLTNQAK